MAKKITKRERQSEENKRKIVDCAMGLFAKHGYDNVSIDDIAKLANSSKGSFYNYFRSKDELFVFYRQALDSKCVDFFDNLMNDPAYRIHNGLQKFYLMSMFILQTISSNGDEFARISDMRLLRDGINSHDISYTKGRRYMLLNDLINMGKSDGSIRKDLSSEDIINSLYQYIDGIMYEWEVSKGAFSTTDRFAYVIEFYCYSISNCLGE